MGVEALVKDVGQLTSLPQVAIKINQLVDDPKASANDISKVISHDPALSMRLLRIANSPLYGLSSKINTIERAVTLLGNKKIRDLVLATSVAKTFDGLPNELVSMHNFWMHSVYCALCARQLASQCKQPVQADVLFIAGLLHDIGTLVIFNKLPDAAREALLYSIEGPEGTEIYQAEREIIHFDHAQVGAELARHWQLPEVLQECIAFHHEPEQAKNYPVETAIVHIANSLAVLAELHSTDEEEAGHIEEAAWEVTGLDRSIIEPTIAIANEQITEVQSSFFPEDKD